VKKIIGFLFLVVMVVFSSALVVSADSITLTNRGETIELTNAIIESNDTFFISLDDLEKINIGYAEIDEYCLRLGKINGKYTVYIYLDDKIYDGNDTYENAVLIENGITYISLNAISSQYSYAEHTVLDSSKNYISLWINDYTTDSYWLTYAVDDSIEIDENGLTVDLYYGSKKNMAVISTAGGKPLPEERFGIDMTSYPADSDIHHLKYTTVKEQKTHTFTNDNRTYTWTYDVVSRAPISGGGISSNTGGSSGGASTTGPINGSSSSSGVSGGGGAASNSSRAFGFIVDTDKYMGGIQACYSYSNIATVTLTSNNIIEFVTVSGTITVPTQEKSLGYQVVAEGNRIVNKTSNGYYSITRKHVDTYTDAIASGECVASYELRLVPNQDYEIYVRFANGKYVKQFIGYEQLTEDQIYNFDNFEESKTIKGTIELPEDVVSLTTLDGTSVEYISGDLILQSDTAPYYIISKTSFMLDLENRTYDFTLPDDMGLGNGYVYFRLDSPIEEVYSAGTYVSNERIGYTKDDSNVVLSGTEGIVLTLSKGKIIETVIEYTAENYNVGDNYILVQENDGTKLDYDKCYLYVYGNRISVESDLDKAYCKAIYKAVIPADKSKYISCLLMQYGNGEYPLYYDTETTTWLDDFAKADIITDESLKEIYNGYKPSNAVLVEGTLHSKYPSYSADFTTIGDFEYLNSTRYIAYYGENDQLLHIESESKDYQVGHISYEDIDLNATYFPLAKEIKMFIWQDNLKPIAEVTIIK